ncbi:MAG: hypothetical protein BWY65_01014 [Firmicutes bacterium ADurb.Bin373]|jgi:hypothetical protein|nr:hypothetical protein [Bacillota bacterium]OQA09638.1 MAG: hypothetical protein BWY65_01014 [Firmicutes bacterium ADurb.Bin373]
MDLQDRVQDGYDQNAIDELNKTIAFTDTKIYWKDGYGWTSRFWESLLAMGWKMIPSPLDPDYVVALDEHGVECLAAGPGRIPLLQLLTNYFIGGG